MNDTRKNAWQLVIIGGGGAGLAAAVEASEQGIADIIVIEKRSTLGGNSAIAGGIFACESPVQARMGIVSNCGHLFKKGMDWAHWANLDPLVLRAFIHKSGETIEWLEDKGIEFDLITFYPGQNPPVQHNPKGFGAALIKLLQNECLEKGVGLLPDSAVKKIIRGEKGAVEGIAVDVKGKPTRFSCESVIIATGGFPGNKELMRRYFPSLNDGLVLSGLPLTGDGIYLAAQAGAAIENMATLIKEGPRFHLHKWPLMALERDPLTLWVNKRGERFTDESTGYHIFESVNAIMRQPDMVCFTLLDSSIRRYFEKYRGKLRTFTDKDSTSVIREEMEKGLYEGLKNGNIKIADTWEEIASWMGVESHTLIKNIKQYNEHCEQGHDTAYAKDAEYLLPLKEPPYYAIRDIVALLDTIGGIRIDEKMRVMDKENRAIPGLYAAGVVTSGWESEIYCSELSASAFGFAINSGRIAAKNAAGYLCSK